MDDLINRYSVLVSKYAVADHIQRIIDSIETDNKYNEGFVDGLKFCIGTLSAAPNCTVKNVGEWRGDTYVGINMAKAARVIIDKQPTAQLQQKTGTPSGARWLINSDGYYPYCSACMAEPKNGVMTDFCPNYGERTTGVI